MPRPADSTTTSDRHDTTDILASVAKFPTVALVLQGGGALGSYQCGVYEGLHDAGIRPNLVAGISIGAINAAIIAGNAPEHRIERLHAFWNLICQPGHALTWPALWVRTAVAAMPPTDHVNSWAASLSAMAALLQGQQGFFEPRSLSPFLLSNGSAEATSFYSTTPLHRTLQEHVDFDRINSSQGIRLIVGATELETGNFRYFDSKDTRIGPEHILASGALPPAFPAIRIEDKHYWDGGLVSNTPLEHVLGQWPREDTLALQVDLWSARGPTPKTMMDVLERIKDIQYSSRTRHGTAIISRTQRLRRALNDLIELLPDQQLPEHLRKTLAPYLDDRVFNIIHLIYQAKPYEEQFKDYAFGKIALDEHWQAGLRDTCLTLEQPDYFRMPSRSRGLAIHDVHHLLNTSNPDA